MRKLTDSEVVGRADLLKKRHRSEWADLVHDACIGRGIREVGRLLDRAPDWVRQHLDYYSVEVAIGGTRATPDRTQA